MGQGKIRSDADVGAELLDTGDDRLVIGWRDCA
ncbi:Uncharacterised protein [Vibrio cholerae]|uniref:Uncharacterized protein n=1 Tax=Vibrio cholerae TaxID=666 RepID=A0A656A705_VIBCL|nr:Uncharacterised protein [Vibrio cholerae]